MKKIHMIIAVAGLVFSNISSAAVTESCEKYFKSVDAYLEEIAKNDAAKAQLPAVKQQYEQSKKQLAALPEAAQNQACEQAHAALTSSMQTVVKAQ